MSMLTEQIKRLRETAAELCQYGTHFGYSVTRDPLMRDAARQMVEAADTIENLRNRLTETCHMVLKDDHEEYGESFFVWWECDECGGVLPNGFGTPEVRYCPNCGRKVVE